ncbi:hypothetical protein EVJ58_g10213 [Rhodofomes roseus]|uniref:Uncharacterized protein n=1 Tax=Rhodofomes roseus TaxID=34475 RepID=A0A4Y9XRR1_9APHY|nr:hypothetical protein EVJ58_g10213 [Rhodofomes roseus]
MSTTLLNEKDVRALKRADIQKLAKREGIRANGKTDAMVVALFAMYPGGILPLEKEKVPVRRSRRRGTPEPKVEEVEEELGGEPPVYGESISQYVPPRRREAVRPAVVAADEQEAQQQQRAPSPLPTPPPPPSPPQHEEEDLPPTLPNTPVPSPVKATSRGARDQRNPPVALPLPAPVFVQGSSRPVNSQAHALQREQGAPDDRCSH